MAYFVFTLLSFIWGTTWIAIKITLEGIPPFLGATVRFVIAIVFLLLFGWFSGVSLGIPRKDYRVLLTSAFFMYVFDYGFVYWGEQYLSAGVTAIFFATFPIFIGLFSSFVVKSEQLGRAQIAGTLFGFLGVFIIFHDQLMRTHFNTQIILATIAIVLGAAGGALSTVLVKKHLHHVPTIPLTIHQMLWGAVFLGMLGILQGEISQVYLTKRVFYAVLYLGAIGSALAFASYYWLLKKISALTISFIIYITPVIALFIDRFLFGTTITWQIVLGSATIFSGITLSQWETYRQWLYRYRQQKLSSL